MPLCLSGEQISCIENGWMDYIMCLFCYDQTYFVFLLPSLENKVLPHVGPYGPHNGHPGAKTKSAGSRRTSSSSSSSGLSSVSPAAYFGGPKEKALISGFEGDVSPAGVLEEDDLDLESGSHNSLCNCQLPTAN